MKQKEKESILKKIYILVKSIFFWIIFLINTLIMALTATFFGLIRMQNTAHKAGILWGKVGRALTGTKVEIRNREKEYKDGPIILMINHQSMFDILVLYHAIDIQFRWLIKDSLFKIPIFGQAIKGVGYISVHRGNRKKAMESLFAASKKIKEGTSVLIFPEGHRGKLPHGEMDPFMKGSFILAKKSKVPIQPITIWGCGEILPKDDKVLIQRVYSGEVKVIFHDTIMPKEYENMDLNKLSNHVHSIIESPMEKLRKEVPLKSGLIQRLAVQAERTKKIITEKTRETKEKLLKKVKSKE